MARAAAPGSRPARTVVIAIDAVPYAVFARLQRQGLFREFFPAARMVAPFPSLTNVGYTAILKTAPVLGYEDKYYDPVGNRIGGGVFDRLMNRYKKVAPFHEVFDWEPPHLWGVTIYYFPMTVSRAELRRIEEILHSSEDGELVLYFGGTDALGHVRGRKGLEECLRLVDQVVKGFLAAGGAERRVVLFSDHGTTAVRSRRIDLEAVLAKSGYRLRSRLEGPRDVVAPAYGLVGAIPLYTRCGEEAAVARAVARAPGVDFAAWREQDRVSAVSGDGRPDALDRPEDRYPDLRARVEQGLRCPRHPPGECHRQPGGRLALRQRVPGCAREHEGHARQRDRRCERRLRGLQRGSPARDAARGRGLPLPRALPRARAAPRVRGPVHGRGRPSVTGQAREDDLEVLHAARLLLATGRRATVT